MIVKNTNRECFPNIIFNGGDNKFNEVLMLGFKNVKLTALDTKSLSLYNTKKFCSIMIKENGQESVLKGETGGDFIVKGSETSVISILYYS